MINYGNKNLINIRNLFGAKYQIDVFDPMFTRFCASCGTLYSYSHKECVEHSERKTQSTHINNRYKGYSLQTNIEESPLFDEGSILGGHIVEENAFFQFLVAMKWLQLDDDVYIYIYRGNIYVHTDSNALMRNQEKTPIRTTILTTCTLQYRGTKFEVRVHL